MIPHIVIVYQPGFAGNFIQRCLALNARVFPILEMHEVKNMHSRLHYSTIERLDLYSFAKSGFFKDWQLFHRHWGDFLQHDLYMKHIEFEPGFNFITFAMHEYERIRKHKPTLDVIGNVTYLGVKMERHKDWLERTQTELGFVFRPGEIEEYQEFLASLPPPQVVDLDLILESEYGFLEEYQRICRLTGIPPETDAALKLYREWYDIRVRDYL